MENLTEIKKDLYKSKANAQFSHYAAGKLYYDIETLGSKYQFPIKVTEEADFEVTLGTNKSKVAENVTVKGKELRLSTDLGNTPFGREVKGSDLIRWIAMAINDDDFVKISL